MIQRLSSSTILGFVLMLTLSSGACRRQPDLSEQQPSSGSSSPGTTVVLPLDGEEEAIAYAESDPAVVEFLKFLARRRLTPGSWAKYEKQNDEWVVVYFAKDAKDLSLAVHIKPDGTVTARKQEGG